MFRAALSGAPARRFFAAHAQSCVGTGLAYVALPLLAYERFGSAWAVALVLLPDLLPAIVLGPLLGALVDRVGWRLCAVVADVLRCGAFVAVTVAGSLPVMIACAGVAGLGTALFVPSALAGLPRLLRGERVRAAGMGLYSVFDDLGMIAGPAVAAGLLAVLSPSALLGLNALTFAVSAGVLASIPAARRSRPASASPAARTSLFADARAGVRALGARPEIRVLLTSSTAVVLCIGVTNVGEVVLAREVLGVGGTGLAVLVTAGGVGTILGSLCARITGAGAWAWRRAYVLGIAAMSAELIACGVTRSFWLVVPALAVGGFGNGLALVHDRLLLTRSTPPSLHGRLFGLQKTCTASAFALSIIASGALIAELGVHAAFLLSGVALAGVLASVTGRLRAAWPSPAPGAAGAGPRGLGDALA
ncbi:MAG TPA: MFS transporter [Solirubrobacter sp.]|nr:MFS transporter [Solirubrobacter sp.]